ncbi:uncharacterized protein LOC106666429 isoform X2 [Cimex lectularius]|uniref:Uncharacterized protein n=1 Tax=Cimex lectularius TaxID=79782 RepID=A0A8I6TEB1_CIMLE|nr:uncharacterized protein LOC106666429 isoform X2 [Cimex lectularius]
MVNLINEVKIYASSVFLKAGIYVAFIDLILQTIWISDVYFILTDLYYIQHYNNTVTMFFPKSFYGNPNLGQFYTMLMHMLSVSALLAVLHVAAYLLNNQSFIKIWMNSKPIFLSLSLIPFIIMCLGERKLFTLLHAIFYLCYSTLVICWILKTRYCFQDKKKPTHLWG